MFALRRIIRNSNHLSSLICTSSVVKCDVPKKQNSSNDPRTNEEKAEQKKQKEEKKTPQINVAAYLGPKKKQPKVRASGKNIEPSLASAVEDVARELGGNKEETKMDLLDFVKVLNVRKEKDKRPERQRTPTLKAEPHLDQHEQERMPRKIPKGNYRTRHSEEKYRGDQKTTLGIFDKNIMQAPELKLKIWDDLKAEELALMAEIPPTNYFDELIKWTNEGRLWRFPIDNDQDLDNEAATSFTEHIFLEKHLKPWCPEKGPIRKFMQMVVIGLGKNPYYTVPEKVDHILWFKEYFERKKKLLQELGAMGPTKIEGVREEQKS